MCVIDPRRDVDVYVSIARRHQARITHILETHVHANLFRARAISPPKPDAQIHLSGNGAYEFPYEELSDGDRFDVGNLTFEVLATPGHTRERISYVVSGGDRSERPWGAFTGDTLFAGEVGRPDLLGEEMKARLVRELFYSLETLVQLGDELEVYPAHGQGSPCGAHIGGRPTTTIGYEKKYNPKLEIGNEIDFVTAVLADLEPAPAYYARMKCVNTAGRAAGETKLPVPMDAATFLAEAGKPRTTVLDTREIEAFGGGHIPDSLNMPHRQEFPIWAGWMLDSNQRILLLLSEHDDIETVARLLYRIGINNVIGYLRQGFRDWTEAGLPFHKEDGT